MLFSVSMFPIGGTDSLVDPISAVVEEIDRAGLDYEVTGMDTVIEGEFDEVLPVVQRAHEMLRESYPRVFTLLAVDDHGGETGRMRAAVRDVEERVGRSRSG